LGPAFSRPLVRAARSKSWFTDTPMACTSSCDSWSSMSMRGGKRSPLIARCTVSDNSETARRSRR
jgi:hypothetical protein